MSQLVAVASPSSGREIIERAARLRRAFYPNGRMPRIKVERIPWCIVYSVPVEINPPPPPTAKEVRLQTALEIQAEAEVLAGMVPQRIRVLDVICATAEHFGIRKIDLLSDRRTRDISRPRMVVMYLSKELTPRSLPEIGRFLGGKDHTSVLHGCRRIADLVAAGDPIAADVEAIRTRLQA